jgi:uracil-DNA glycosylase family 4
MSRRSGSPPLPVIESLAPDKPPVAMAAVPVTSASSSFNGPQRRPCRIGKTGCRRLIHLDELREAIAAFDGIALKKDCHEYGFLRRQFARLRSCLSARLPAPMKTASASPSSASVASYLDKILKCINLDRKEEDPAVKAIYISNILNWRPPGNRTPSPAEIDVSLPFIEKHIALIKPKLLILCGGVSAQALLNTEQSVSRLRGKWHDYRPSSALPERRSTRFPRLPPTTRPICLRTPSQKRAVWQDMLTLAV